MMRSIPPLLLAIALCGCALLAPRFRTPRLSVLDVQVTKADLWQQQLQVRMRVENPNDRALPVRGLSYAISVDEQPLATGVSDASFVVPARGSADFNMSVTATLAGPLLTVLSRGRGPVDYRLTGKVELSHGWLRSIPFEERGTFLLR
jgi:LEA14-like dessication related protein